MGTVWSARTGCSRIPCLHSGSALVAFESNLYWKEPNHDAPRLTLTYQGLALSLLTIEHDTDKT